MVKIGIIGTGLIARYHAEAIKECMADCQIWAICDIDEKKMKKYAEDMELGSVRQYTSYKELIDSSGVDMVSVCTSNDTHKEITVYAAEKGMNLLCEKPLGLNSDEVEMMAAACEKNNVVNMTGFTYRRIPAMAMIKKMIDDGSLGRIYHYRGRFYADRMAPVDHPLEWRHLEEKAGSGVLGDLASHTLDMALYLLNHQCTEIKDVFADASIFVPYRKDEVSGVMTKVTSDDVCNIIAHFEDGTEVVLENSRYSPFEMEIHISGEKGSIKYNLSNYDEFQLMLYESPADYFKTFKTVKVPPEKRNNKLMPSDRMARQYAYMTECVEKHKMAQPAIGETIYIQKLLDVMKTSYKKDEKIYL